MPKKPAELHSSPSRPKIWGNLSRISPMSCGTSTTCSTGRNRCAPTGYIILWRYASKSEKSLTCGLGMGITRPHFRRSRLDLCRRRRVVAIAGADRGAAEAGDGHLDLPEGTIQSLVGRRVPENILVAGLVSHARR